MTDPRKCQDLSACDTHKIKIYLKCPVIFDAESKWKTLIPGPAGLDGAQIYSQREFIEIWRDTDKSKDTKHNEDILQLYIMSHRSSLALLDVVISVSSHIHSHLHLNKYS